MKTYGKIKWQGKTLTLTQEAYCDNYGKDGGVRYYAHAVDKKGNVYKVAWDTTAEWDAMARASTLQEFIKHAENHGEDCLIERHELEQITSDYGDVDYYNFDESGACDWDKPVSVELVEEISTAAATLGRKGGLVKSEAKTRAVRENGKKGGRPPEKKWFAVSISSTVDAATQDFSANDFDGKKRTTRQWKTFLEKKGYSDFTIKGFC